MTGTVEPPVEEVDPQPAAGTAAAGDLLAAVAAIRRNIRRRAERPVLLSRLTGSQLELIRVVRRRPGVSVAEAAVDLSLAPNTVSTLVRELTDAGLLVRQVDPADRRVARLDLDPPVRQKVGMWSDRRAEVLGGAVDRLTPRDRRRLDQALPVLQRLARHLELDLRTERARRADIRTGTALDDHHDLDLDPVAR
jgi:DNA-binding MarR family transcriptional regulator